MVIDIKNDEGRVVYQMDSPMVSELGSVQKLVADMPALVKKCREHGIYLIGRIVAFKDPFLAENRPELALHNQDGSVFRDKSGLAWVNPYSRCLLYTSIISFMTGIIISMTGGCGICMASAIPGRR